MEDYIMFMEDCSRRILYPSVLKQKARASAYAPRSIGLNRLQ
jgi:hypothetical protein